jgi:hypothetical protein
MSHPNIPDDKHVNQYNVIVDVHIGDFSHDLVAEQFSNAIHTEAIGNNKEQIGLGIFAPHDGEAYRRGVDVVEAELACLNLTAPAILSVEVYGPDDEHTVFE